MKRFSKSSRSWKREDVEYRAVRSDFFSGDASWRFFNFAPDEKQRFLNDDDTVSGFQSLPSLCLYVYSFFCGICDVWCIVWVKSDFGDVSRLKRRQR